MGGEHERTRGARMDVEEELRRYWDADAATYDDAVGHRPRSAAVKAAWLAAMRSLLPPAPAKVLDCGAGTGFLSLMAARLGHDVTALDFSQAMLDRLGESARCEGLKIATMLGSATAPPGGFDVIMERHLIWTLQDPQAVLETWRRCAAALVVIETVWGTVDPIERLLSKGRESLGRWRRIVPDHHAPYPKALRSSLPLSSGTFPRRVAEVVSDAGWGDVEFLRLRDVEWASLCELPLVERLLGVAPRFAVTARARTAGSAR